MAVLQPARPERRMSVGAGELAAYHLDECAESYIYASPGHR